MVVDILLQVFFSIIDLLRGTFIFSIPLFILVLVTEFFKNAFQKKFNSSFMNSTLIVTYLINLVLITFLYFFPFISSIPEETIGIRPEAFQLGTGDFLLIFGLGFAKIIFVTLTITLILIPFIILGLYFFDKISEKYKFARLLRLYLSVFLTAFIGFALLLFVFPWLPLALSYFLYFGLL